MQTVSMSMPTFMVWLATAFIVGAVVYDAVDTALDDAITARMNARRNFPVRLIVWGVLGLVVAILWIALWNWVVALILLAAVGMTFGGFAWYRHTHHS